MEEGKLLTGFAKATDEASESLLVLEIVCIEDRGVQLTRVLHLQLEQLSEYDEEEDVDVANVGRKLTPPLPLQPPPPPELEEAKDTLG